MALDIQTIEHNDQTLRLILKGSLDSETYPVLENQLNELMDGDIKLVALDLEYLDFISSAGLRVVFSTLKKLKARNGKLAVSNMQPGVKKVFEIVKALPDLSVFASVAELDDYLAGFQKQEF